MNTTSLYTSQSPQLDLLSVNASTTRCVSASTTRCVSASKPRGIEVTPVCKPFGTRPDIADSSTDDERGADPDARSYGYDPHNRRTIGDLYGTGQLPHRCTGPSLCPACRVAQTTRGADEIAKFNAYPWNGTATGINTPGRKWWE